jgi:hypothetical protein
MLLFDGALGVLMFALWLFCIIDVITTPDGSVRNLPKLIWLFIVILLPDVGSIAWLVAGRNWNGRADLPYNGNTGSGRARGPAGAPARTRATNPDDDEEFLAGLKARADEQRRRARGAEGDGPATGNGG